MRSRQAAVAALLCAAVTAAQAQAIYRCGDSYGQQPCAGGQQLAPAAPAPSPADRAQALANTRRDAAMASTLERDRQREERQAASIPPYLPAGMPDTAFEDARSPEKKATRKLDLFTAHVPGTGRSRHEKDKAADKPHAAKSGSQGRSSEKAPAHALPAGQRAMEVAKPAKPARQAGAS